MIQLISSAFFCLILADFTASTPLTESDKTGLANVINTERASILATDMMKMIWDSSLESVADAAFPDATSCPYSVSNNKPAYGFTYVLIGTGSLSTVLSAVNLFTERLTGEKAYFDATTQTCSPSCPLYLQVVTANASRFACAQRYCPTHPYGRSVVCMYNEKYIHPAYTEGNSTTACTECPAGVLCDSQKLCDDSLTTTVGPTTSSRGSDKSRASSVLTASLLSVVLYVGL